MSVLLHFTDLSLLSDKTEFVVVKYLPIPILVDVKWVVPLMLNNRELKFLCLP